MSFRPGTTVVLREVLDGRVRSARPLRVVEDGPQRFVGYLVPRSTVAWPRLADGRTQSQTPDQGWQLPLEEWQGPGALFVMPAGAGFAAVLLLDRDTHEPVGWKVDFLRPPTRHRLGLDTLDHAFDLLATADLSAWETKDLDDLAQLVRLGLLDGEERRGFEAERARVEGWLRAPARDAAPTDEPDNPLSTTWTAWRPDPSWPPLQLPAGWDDLRGAAAPDDPTTSRPGRRSATGIRVLDDAGMVRFDLDLDGGRLWLGHAPPSLVDALSRQLALGWRLGPRHPAFDALGRRLTAMLPAGWSTAWADRRYGADLDEALAAGWPPPVAERCAADGAGLGTFGPRLFGGFDRYVVVGPPDVLRDAGVGGAAPDLLAAVAALETMQLGVRAAVVAAEARAERLRRRCGLAGDGLVLAGPPGWSAPGVIVPADGRGLLALCADDDDEAELGDRLCRRSGP